MNRYFFSAIIYLLAVSVANSQPAKYTIANVHAHNDYQYNVPFTQAYALKIGSIEADVFLVHDTLFVAHHIEEIRRDVLFETAYLQKLDQMVREHSGYAYGDSLSVLQLLIDIKTDSLQTLDAVIKSIRKFPLLVNNRSIRFVITGNQTPAEQFAGYPSFILFDGKINDLSHRHQLNRIGIYSANFATYSKWKGEGDIPAADLISLKKDIATVHALHKQIRFWGVPDNLNTWQIMMKLGVDYINTDHIADVAKFMSTLPTAK